MEDIFLGLLAIAAGLVLCVGGAFVLRVVIVMWGALAGFTFGAGLVAGLSDERFLGTALGWVLGLVFALVVGLLANAFFALGVLLAMASVGFTLGSGLVVALGIDWTWVGVLVGIGVGLVLGLVSVIADVPSLILVLLSAVSGAVVLVAGVMLLTGALDSADFTRSDFTARVKDDWWYYALFVVAAVLGAVSQIRSVTRTRRSMRAAWATREPFVST